MMKRVLLKSPNEDFILSSHVQEPDVWSYVGMISTGGSPAILTRSYSTKCGKMQWGFKHLKYPDKHAVTFACNSHTGAIQKALTYKRQVFQFGTLDAFLEWALETEQRRHFPEEHDDRSDDNYDC